MAKLLYKASSVFNDTIRLLYLLKDSKLSKLNIDGIESLETQLRKGAENQTRWTMNSKLIFKNINKADLNIPEEIEKNVNEILLELKVEITENAYPENCIKDCIEQTEKVKYGVQLIAYGKSLSNNYKIAWHLDKHIRSDNDGRGKGFIHPEYHFNMGGFALTKETDFNYGKVLLIDTPRIIQPPLDVVLAVDFVLTNFYGIRVKNLIESNQYNTIISNAKKRLWRPYFISIANYWEPSKFTQLNIEQDYGGKNLGYC